MNFAEGSFGMFLKPPDLLLQVQFIFRSLRDGKSERFDVKEIELFLKGVKQEEMWDKGICHPVTTKIIYQKYRS